ncbi:MAG TPA: hypothetical protein VH309_06135 [Elusimicrobiota bacterium]|nr:hypothetical protein [Elusimicrobiota bacterium]
MKPGILLCAVLLCSGCADILYTPTNAALDDPDVSGCDQQALEDNMVKGCRRLGEAVPMKSAAPFSGVVRRTTVADPYKLDQKPSLAAQFFFEMTPLGVFAPLFDYPPTETIYTGRVELALASPGAPERDASKFDFQVKGGETFTRDVGSRTISIRCRPRGCALTSTPP